MSLCCRLTCVRVALYLPDVEEFECVPTGICHACMSVNHLANLWADTPLIRPCSSIYWCVHHVHNNSLKANDGLCCCQHPVYCKYLLTTWVETLLNLPLACIKNPPCSWGMTPLSVFSCASIWILKGFDGLSRPRAVLIQQTLCC